MERKAYPSDVSDKEWALVAPCLALMTEDAPQRAMAYAGSCGPERNGAGCPMTCRPGRSSINSRERWIKAGVFESLVHDLHAVLRIADGRKESSTAAIFDSRTLQSTPESNGRAGYGGAKRRKGSNILLAVDTPRHLLALCVTAADEQDCP
jgi:transposase